MRKNLFLQSFKHLEQQKEKLSQNTVEIQREPSLFTPSPVKEEITPEEEKDVPEGETKQNKKNPFAIYLGKGLVFLNPDVAYQQLLQQPKQELPPRYRNSLTKAFFNGTETGQLNTLYKDWKKYKDEVLPKISEYFIHVKNNPDKCPMGKKFATFVIANYTPTSEETFVDGCVDLWFFKFWVLFKFYVTTVK